MSSKRVTFTTDPPQIHEMRTWSYAYQSARKGEWMMAARDRSRFMRRIHTVSAILAPILCQKHREKIFNERSVSAAGRLALVAYSSVL